jgi:flavodoxin II
MTRPIGICYGSSTCYTEMVAEKIQQMLGESRVDLIDIKDADLASLQQYDFIIFGIPTWDYGELQEDWDDRWEDLDEMDFSGLTCAIYGLGDQEGYPEWFQDAIGYLYHKLKSLGADLKGHWPNQGYEFKESKALTADESMFVGLALDDENQPELTDERLTLWLKDLQLLS